MEPYLLCRRSGLCGLAPGPELRHPPGIPAGPVTAARCPNTGWSYPTTVVNPKTTFSNSTLTKPRLYFNGAVCHIKPVIWCIDHIPITSSLGPTITLASNPWYDISTGFGYYLTSIVGEINEEGEWAYDPARRRLYLGPRGDDPEEVESTHRGYCVRTYDRVAYNTGRGLTLRNPYQYGVFLCLANHMTIENNTIEYAFTYGIQLQSTGGPCDYNQILRNTIRYRACRAINVGGEAAHCNVEGHSVHATVVEHFAGDLMHGPSEGIYIAGP
ncbi:MAG: right-handed parallel beta-helix repeat-containing protein [Planctomycetes bacterium]|nr:right-handed parallel beta-helix repeat-containing protein [Planctomycetota bacterium]